MVTLAASFARLKLVAVFAGAAGVGTLGLYNAALSLISTLSSFGIDASGVRQVASHAGESGSSSGAAKVITTLRRVSLLTGFIGAAATLLLAEQISIRTFGDSSHTDEFRVLSLCVFLGQLSLSQSALLRGLRRVKELALQSILVAVVSIALSAALFLFLGDRAILPMIVVYAVVGLAGTWWYARRVEVVREAQTFRDTIDQARALLSLGVAFLLSSLISTVGAYVIGVLINDTGGAAANGIYQAAWSCTGAFAGFVLGAMGQDFYPSLTAIVHDKPAASRLVDQQVEVGILMALPGLMLIVALAPLIVPMLFTQEFLPAVDLIKWMSLGCLGRVLSWPLGYYLLSAGLGRWFVATETMFVCLHVALVFYLMPEFGIMGASISFAILYAAYWLGMIMVVRCHTGLMRSKASCIMAIGSIAMLGICGQLATLPALALFVATAFFCIKSLIRLLGAQSRLARKAASLPLIGPYLLP